MDLSNKGPLLALIIAISVEWWNRSLIKEKGSEDIKIETTLLMSFSMNKYILMRSKNLKIAGAEPLKR